MCYVCQNSLVMTLSCNIGRNYVQLFHFITLASNFNVFLLVTGVLQVNCAVKSHSDEWPREQIMIGRNTKAIMIGFDFTWSYARMLFMLKEGHHANKNKKQKNK